MGTSKQENIKQMKQVKRTKILNRTDRVIKRLNKILKKHKEINY